jgi:outer membrane protein assembly factor BamB
MGRVRPPAVLALLLAAGAGRADDWPQWLGPTRDGCWHEPGILAKFPAGGPKKLWSKPIKLGYSGPAVADGKVFVHDYDRTQGDLHPSPAKRNMLSGKERVLCFDAKTGHQDWKHEYECPYDVSYPSGPRCTPAIADGKVYTLGTMGNLCCLDALKGTVVWEKDFKKDFDAPTPTWGFCGHPLIYRKLVIVPVGGKIGLLVAFDKDTGNVEWGGPHGGEHPGYGPAALIRVDGKVSELAFATPTAVIGLDPATGKPKWEVPFKPNYMMSIAAPRQADDVVFAGGYGDAVAIKLNPIGGVSELWRAKRNTGVTPSNCTPVIADGVIYGVDNDGELRAVDLKTGERLWDTTEPVAGEANKPLIHGTAFLVRNEDQFFIFNERGELIIAKLTPAGYAEIDRAKLVEPTGHAMNRDVVWSHPAFAEKHIFVRNDKEIACYSLAK